MMKKLTIIIALLLVLAITVNAAPRASTAYPSLSFSGTTANCGAVFTADNTDDFISITLRLDHGSTNIATWYASGHGYVSLSKTATVTKGYTYTLTATYRVNGVYQPSASVSAYCAG